MPRLNQGLCALGLALLVSTVSAACSYQATGGAPSAGGLSSGGLPTTGGSPGSGGKDGSGAPGAADGGDATGTADGGGAAGTADGGGAGGSAHGGSLGEGGQPADPENPSSLDAPTNLQDLDAFLELGRYKSWAAEPSLHRGRGPHGRDVRVFYSPKAAAALTASAEAFPRGAAVVKEIVVDNASGWAVWIKAEADSDNGNSFYWYELIVGSDNTRTVYGGTFNAPGCVGCHRSGHDYLLADGTFE
jgi:hypothetical protein